LAAASEMEFGRFEAIRIRGGELVVSPFPPAIRTLKFGSASRDGIDSVPSANLKKQAEEFLNFVRGVYDGIIRHLEVRHGLPFSMKIEYCISRVARSQRGAR
jgi:hypothetical protein